jgi:hypothetical protein
VEVGLEYSFRDGLKLGGSAGHWSGRPGVEHRESGMISRHREDERHFEVIAGKVIGAQSSQSRFAFARNSPAIVSGAFNQALAMVGVTAHTPATVLCDGDA